MVWVREWSAGGASPSLRIGGEWFRTIHGRGRASTTREQEMNASHSRFFAGAPFANGEYDDNEMRIDEI